MFRHIVAEGDPMQKLDAPRARISRQTVRALWWGYASGLGFCAILTIAGALTRGPEYDGWSAPEVVCSLAALLAALGAHRLTAELPPAGHRVFDAVGERFEFAMRQLFLRFVLAGAASEVTGLLGAVLYVLGAPTEIAFGFVAAGIVLLVRLRARVAPLVHYLA